MSYQLFDISTLNGFDDLQKALQSVYQPEEVVAQLRAGLDARCKQILVEYNYNDKDYRSTYYSYYAKKGYRYEINCVRLHFFDDAVKLNGWDLRFEKGPSSYFGYMVLRPTKLNTIGRTVISPGAVRGFHGHLIEADHKVHLLGHRLLVKGFPYMSQHSDISVCAHAACWAILRHNSERFSRYAEFLTYDITRMAHEIDPGGLLPSNGLHVGHAERIFAEAGTYPMLILKDDTEPGAFRRQLFAYIESGFPLFAEIEKEQHAVAIIGYGPGVGHTTKPAPCHFHSDRMQSLIVMDDNFFPYHEVTATDAQGYGWQDFSAFIVPLPDKVYYPADAVDERAMLLATEPYFGFDHSALGSPTVRYFLTTAAHLRKFTHQHRSQFDPELAGAVMELSLPQFVWIIEIASDEQARNGQIQTRAIIDATASPYEDVPVFLMYDKQRAYYCDRGGNREPIYVDLKSPNAPLSKMPGNLETH